MRRPPELKEIGKYPVTGGVGLLAVGVTIAWMLHWDIAPLVESGPKMWREPWRLLTSTLPHVGVFHLLFNVYWLWVFGTLLEKEFGHLRYAGLLVLLAAGSGAAEFAVLNGGVGLSGVGYGLFGMLWVLSLFDQRFSDAIDRNTVVTFVLWFFLCIVLTVTNVMPVGNVAHGAGAVLGALVGWVYVSRGRRVLPMAVLVAALGVIAWGASVGRTEVNFSSGAGGEYAYEGYQLLKQNKQDEALEYYKQAIKFRKVDAGTYYNMGCAYYQLKQMDKSLPYFREAVRRDPSNMEWKKFLMEMETYAAAAGHEAASQPEAGASTRRN